MKRMSIIIIVCLFLLSPLCYSGTLLDSIRLDLLEHRIDTAKIELLHRHFDSLAEISLMVENKIIKADSSLSANSSEKISEMRTLWRGLVDLTLLKNEEINDLYKTRKMVIYSTGIVFIIIIIILSFIYYRQNKHIKLVNQILNEKNEQIESTNIELQQLNEYITEQNITLSSLNEDLAEKHYEITLEQEIAENLLLNILPENIAIRLKQGEERIADYFDDASVIFMDIVGFTKLSSELPPKDVVDMLNDVFSQFDALAEKHGLEKIKTIGDCYMAVAGAPEPRPDHSHAAANYAIEAKALMKNMYAPNGAKLQFRIGIDSGSVIAGVIGKKKFIYDLWGDTVNIASRMQDCGIVGEIHVTDRFKKMLESIVPQKSIKGVTINYEEVEKEDSIIQSDDSSENSIYYFRERGVMEIKGKGLMRTWILER